MRGQQHPQVDTDHQYTGRRGPDAVKGSHAVEITELVGRVERKDGPLIQTVRMQWNV
jgi:hypothetical protein